MIIGEQNSNLNRKNGNLHLFVNVPVSDVSMVEALLKSVTDCGADVTVDVTVNKRGGAHYGKSDCDN